MKYFIIPLSFALFTTTLAVPAPKVEPVTTPTYMCITTEKSPTTSEVSQLISRYTQSSGACSFYGCGTLLKSEVSMASISFCGSSAALYGCKAAAEALNGIYSTCKKVIGGVERTAGIAVFPWGTFYVYNSVDKAPEKKKVPETLVLDTAEP